MTLLALWGLVSPAVADTERFALLAGANHGGVGRVQLQYAVADARSMGDVLADLGGVPRSHQTLLVDPDATSLRAAIQGLGNTVRAAEARGARTEVVVYYSGHSDDTGLLMGSSHYGYPDLKRELEAIGADAQVVVLDSCAAGAMVRRKGGVHRPAFLDDSANDVEGTAYLLSASENESAQESDVVGASYFTHFLVSGLRGGADSTGDGRVTLQEAYTFASEETLRRTERTSVGAQHALFDMNMKGHGGFVFTDLSKTTSSLVFAESMRGRLFVRNGTGALVAELDKPNDRAVELALREGSYRVVLDQGGTWLEADFEIGPAEHLLVDDLEFRTFERERVVARGPTPGLDLPTPPPDHPDKRLQFGAVVRGEQPRVQVALLLADATDQRGLQVAVGVAVAEEVHGAQVGFLGNVAQEVVGGQTALLGVNVADEVDGAQVGLINVTDRIEGAQTGLVNHAPDLQGMQVGLVNHARRGKSLQLGLVNAGGDSGGFQLGLVNVANDYKGAAFGLVTVHKKGYNHVFAGISTLDGFRMGASWGSRFLYTSVQLTLGSDLAHPSIAGGLGVHVQGEKERLFVDFDGVFGVRSFGRPSSTPAVDGSNPIAYGIFRSHLQVGLRLAGRFAVLAGPVLEVPLIAGGGTSPGFVVGVRL